VAEAPEGLLKRAAAAEAKRDAFAALMRDIYAYAMPERDAWSAYGYGANRQVRVFDSTAVIAAGRFANRLQQALFPPQQRWAALALPPELAEQAAATEVQRDLEAATDLLFAHLHASNFDQVINEWALDLAAGVGCLLIENGRLGTRRPNAPLLRFQAVPAALVAFDEGPFGTVEGVFFTQRMPARLIRRTYPDATLPRELRQTAQQEPEREIELLQATVYDPERDRWRQTVVERRGKAVLASRSYRVSPWIVTRWSKSPGEAYGRGPLAAALPDVRVLNRLMELYLKAASLVVTPVYTVEDDGVVNPATIRLVPGAFLPVRSNGGARGRSIAPLDPPSSFTLSNDLMERLRTAIRQTLFDDPLPPEVQVGLTATEVIERVRRFQQDTGAFGRMQADALAPIVLRCLDILDEAGELADGRFAGLMQAVRDDAVRIQAMSPLAQAQDRADVQSVMSFLSSAGALGQFGAGLIESGIDLARAGPWVAARAGVPALLIPSAAELRAREEAAQSSEAERAALTSPVLAQAAGALARGAVEAGREAA
jgi:hypothetical protein